MIITCKECNTSYNLDDSLVQKGGSKVRCSKCGHVFITHSASEKEHKVPSIENIAFKENKALTDRALKEEKNDEDIFSFTMREDSEDDHDSSYGFQNSDMDIDLEKPVTQALDDIFGSEEFTSIEDIIGGKSETGNKKESDAKRPDVDGKYIDSDLIVDLDEDDDERTPWDAGKMLKSKSELPDVDGDEDFDLNFAMDDEADSDDKDSFLKDLDTDTDDDFDLNFLTESEDSSKENAASKIPGGMNKSLSSDDNLDLNLDFLNEIDSSDKKKIPSKKEKKKEERSFNLMDDDDENDDFDAKLYGKDKLTPDFSNLAEDDDQELNLDLNFLDDVDEDESPKPPLSDKKSIQKNGTFSRQSIESGEEDSDDLNFELNFLDDQDEEKKESVKSSVDDRLNQKPKKADIAEEEDDFDINFFDDGPIEKAKSESGFDIEKAKKALKFGDEEKKKPSFDLNLSEKKDEKWDKESVSSKKTFLSDKLPTESIDDDEIPIEIMNHSDFDLETPPSAHIKPIDAIDDPHIDLDDEDFELDMEPVEQKQADSFLNKQDPVFSDEAEIDDIGDEADLLAEKSVEPKKIKKDIKQPASERKMEEKDSALKSNIFDSNVKGVNQKADEKNYNEKEDEDDELELNLNLDFGEDDSEDESIYSEPLKSSSSDSIKTPQPVDEDEDFDLNFDIEDFDEQEIKNEPASLNTSEYSNEDDLIDLDFDLDEDSEKNMPSQAQAKKDEVSESLDDDLDLDLDLNIDEEKEEYIGKELEDALQAESEFEDSVADDDGISEDFNFDFDLEAEEEDSQPVDAGSEMNSDIDFDLEEDSENSVTEEESEEDFLDFSDLDGIVDSEDDVEPVALESKNKKSNLGFDDEDEFDEDDLDLSDIESMLEDGNNKSTLEASATSLSDDLDIEFEDVSEAEKWMDDSSVKGGNHEFDEFDLSELESSLDFSDTKKEKSERHEEFDGDLEFDIDDDFDLSKSDSDEMDMDLDLNLDLTKGVGTKSPGKPAGKPPAKSPAGSERIDAGDMELEFEIEDDEPDVAEATVARFSDARQIPSVPGGGDDYYDEFVEPDEYDEDDESIEKPKKKGMNKSFIFVFLIFAMAFAGFGIYFLINMSNVNIPVVGKMFNSDANDPGNLKLSTFDIKSKFVENKTAGKFFVITGKVRNDYPQSRGFIQLTGKLFTKGKNFVKSETVYCGNILTDSELASLDLNNIKNRLVTRFGDTNVNAKVQPGKSIDFMVVFSNLPEDTLEEFTIEVVKSTPFE